jgi:hypothetical protein
VFFDLLTQSVLGEQATQLQFVTNYFFLPLISRKWVYNLDKESLTLQAYEQRKPQIKGLKGFTKSV